MEDIEDMFKNDGDYTQERLGLGKRKIMRKNKVKTT